MPAADRADADASRPRPVRRALVSVSDKAGLAELTGALARHGVEVVSTGGTARAIEGAGHAVRRVSELTGFPEVMGGRVKTLHPVIHGGILADRDDPEHARAMDEHGIGPIDLVCINLYPFERTVAGGAGRGEAVEQIDIGGPAMIRAAAKNHEHVAVVTDPAQYGRVIDELDAGGGATSGPLRRELARAAFARTAAYDAAIADWLGRHDADANTDDSPDPLPAVLTLRRSGEPLRYGENPHQSAAVYDLAGARGGGPDLAHAEPLHGKALSYNNLSDASAALALAGDLARLDPDRPAAVVVKHTNPCGAATGPTALDAIDGALAGDPLAAYGGILATSAAIDNDAAERLCGKDLFLEVVAAAGFAPSALDRLRGRWKNLRLLAVGDASGPPAGAVSVRTIAGGALVQGSDSAGADTGSWTHAAGPAPDPPLLARAAAVWLVAKHLTSNAIAIGGPDADRPGVVRLFGAGAGQMDRVAACELAVRKAAGRSAGAIAASDAFFPFSDGPGLLIDAGVATLVQPGGSKRDGETLELCEGRGVTCLLTGKRHFRH